LLTNLLTNVHPIHARQHNIQDNEVGPLHHDLGKRFFAVQAVNHLKPGILKPQADHLSEIFFVFEKPDEFTRM
jgi:hypothetical protein